MKNIVITGASGVVGSILSKGLAGYFSLTPLSKQNCDARNIEDVRREIADNTDVIIHLSWKSEDIYKNGQFDHDNILMALNVLEVAVEKKIKRVILASSVHANEYRLINAGVPPTQTDWPTSIYGATKIYIEALGKYYAKYRGIEVVVVRFGGINVENSPTAKNEVDYDKIFLSHDDLVDGIKTLITEDIVDYKIVTIISHS